MKLRGLVLALVFLTCAAIARAEPASKADPKAYPVPFRLTDTLHVLVRVKIDGKGPFNFIVDTGAPLLYVTKDVGKKLGLEADKKGWIVLPRFEIEGGLVKEKVRALLETPFQLEGMNALGLAGAELHGIIGYSFLAHYRMEVDLAHDRMTWTVLDFKPPAPQPLGGKGSAAPDLSFLGTMMKVFSAVLGKQPPAELSPRGYLGIELAEQDGSVTVRRIFDKGPASAAGLKTGDRIASIQGKNVRTVADVHRHGARIAAGQAVRLTVLRQGEKKEITITAGEGL
jgi:PDZ domain-containing protein/aspartyl protease